MGHFDGTLFDIKTGGRHRGQARKIVFTNDRIITVALLRNGCGGVDEKGNMDDIHILLLSTLSL